MSKRKKSKSAKTANGSLVGTASKFASRNRRSLGLGAAGAGLAAAALLIGRRYRERQAGASWRDEGSVGAAS